MAAQSKIDIWITRVVLISVAALAGVFLWRMSMVAYRLEQSITAVSADVQQVTGVVASVARQVERVSGRVERLEQKAADAIGIDEIENVLDELAFLRKTQAEKTLSADARREIQALLDAVHRSGCTFERSGKALSGTRFYVYVLAKYKLYEKTLTSAEDFIDKVATKTMSGEPYRVVLEGGDKQPLSEWLKVVLEDCRVRGGKSEKPADAPQTAP